MIIGFSHIQLVVGDLETSAQWFIDVLGVERFASGTTTSGSYAALRHADARFVIGMQTAEPGDLTSPPSAAAIDHLAFAVADRSAIDAWRTQLARKGIAVSDVYEEAASYNARTTSPDGLVIELTARK